MTRQQELDRCDAEIARCKDEMAVREDALVGWRDWEREKRLIEGEAA